MADYSGRVITVRFATRADADALREAVTLCGEETGEEITLNAYCLAAINRQVNAQRHHRATQATTTPPPYKGAQRDATTRQTLDGHDRNETPPQAPRAAAAPRAAGA